MRVAVNVHTTRLVRAVGLIVGGQGHRVVDAFGQDSCPSDCHMLIYEVHSHDHLIQAITMAAKQPDKTFVFVCTQKGILVVDTPGNVIYIEITNDWNKDLIRILNNEQRSSVK